MGLVRVTAEAQPPGTSWPRRLDLLSKAFAVFSNYSTKKEMHLTCK